MNVDPRSCATLGEVLKYAEMGNMEGITPEFARYLTDNFNIEPVEVVCERCKELEGTLDEIEALARNP